ncbi:hypothetical protein SAY86_006537 [Trapa natans]|uniref:DC1 domain-containing protein n=1 Tax=Trapa natans TaxID=22666 RepID=A0AAN7L7I6_TRANT|nr:hypothetical protein SAY86_006537 [Trapa natans]
MGKLNHEPSIRHFSHPHPLDLTTLQYQPTLTITICSCCGLPCDGRNYTYTCRTCTVGSLGGGGFALHADCAQMHSLITHPSHPGHPLTLHPSPPYQGASSFNCDACGRSGSAFCYHCSVCDFDLHPTCASKPLFAAHPHHPHQLGLEFFPPYPARAFSCDICRDTGKNHWLYRCSSCEFDAHLDCATPIGGGPTGQAPQPQPQQQPRPMSVLQHYPSYPGTYNANNGIRQLQPPQPGSWPQPQMYQLQQQISAPANLQNYQYQQPPAVRPMVGTQPQMYQPPQQLAAAGLGAQQQPNSFGNMIAQSFIDAFSRQAVQNVMGGDNNGSDASNAGVDDAGGDGNFDTSGIDVS